MAYDNDSRDRFRGRDESRYGGPGRDSGGRDERGGRGFFERAGDEISSWFGDEDAERRRERDDRAGGGEQGSGRSPDRDRGGDRGWLGGGRGRDEERGGWFGGRPDHGPDRHDREREAIRQGRDPSREQPGPRARSNDGPHQSYGRDDVDRSRGSEYRPFAGDYGRGTADRGGNAPFERSQSGDSGGRSGDPHYQEWRQRQIAQLDRDYDDYCREHQSKFDNDFTGWRTQKQSQRQILSQVREHMEVVGSDDQSLGQVDKVQDDRIVLTKNSEGSGGVHRSFAASAISRVDGDRLVLAQPADEARKSLREERGFVERNDGDRRPTGEAPRPDQQDGGPHILDRSFSGTYR